MLRTQKWKQGDGKNYYLNVNFLNKSYGAVVGGAKVWPKSLTSCRTGPRCAVRKIKFWTRVATDKFDLWAVPFIELNCDVCVLEAGCSESQKDDNK